jgi:hypothetical protein
VFGGGENNSQPENNFCLTKMLSKSQKMNHFPHTEDTFNLLLNNVVDLHAQAVDNHRNLVGAGIRSPEFNNGRHCSPIPATGF